MHQCFFFLSDFLFTSIFSMLGIFEGFSGPLLVAAAYFLPSMSDVCCSHF